MVNACRQEAWLNVNTKLVNIQSHDRVVFNYLVLCLKGQIDQVLCLKGQID